MSSRSLEVPSRQAHQTEGIMQVNMDVGVESKVQNQDELSRILDASYWIMVATISTRGLTRRNVQ